jgi:hypothetical protein
MTPLTILNNHFQGRYIYGYTPMIEGRVLGQDSMTIFKRNIKAGVEYRAKQYGIKGIDLPTREEKQEYSEPLFIVLENEQRFPIWLDFNIETL